MRPIVACVLALVACSHAHRGPDRGDAPTEPPPPTNDDPSCLPAPPVEPPVVAQAQAEQLKRLIMATEASDPEMPALVLRLAQSHFAGGFVSAGCRITDVAMRLGDAAHRTKATELRLRHCFDGRAQRCTGWFAPRVSPHRG